MYLTPWGSSTRNWLASLTLTSPSIEHSEINESSQKTLFADWNLQSTKGEEIWISSIRKPLFVNIWATWCPPCRAELPSIISLAKKYDSEIEFLLVSPDESMDELKKFANEQGYEIPFYNELNYTPDNLQTSSYPTTFILTKDKEVTHKMVGSHNWDSEDVHHLLDLMIENN